MERNNSVAEYLEAGYALCESKQYEKAMECYDKAIQINPDDSDIYYNKGHVFFSLKKYDQAIQNFNKAIELNPKDILAQNDKGNSLYRLKKYEEAVACHDIAIELDPKNSSSYLNKGNALFGLKKYEEAMKCYDIVIELYPEDPTAYNHKGHALRSLNLFHEAIACYNKAIELDPKYSTAYSNKGNALKELKLFNEALACYNKAIELNPHYTAAIKNKNIVIEEMTTQLEKIKLTERRLSDPYANLNTIQKEDITIKKEIGRGGFGVVYKAEYGFTDAVVKQIIINDSDEEKEEVIQWISNEVNLLSKIKHPNLILYYGCYQENENSVGIVTEYCKGGDLYQLLHKKKIKLTVKQKMKILIEVASGMWYLHNKMKTPILHRDLKSPNILLIEEIINDTSIPVAKITDFGISRIVEESRTVLTLTSGLGTISWTAPEILKNERYGLSADVYSFGILMWEIFTEKLPFSDLKLNQMQLAIKICNENIKPKMDYLKENTPQEIKNLIEKCIASCDKRPTFEEIGFILKEIKY